MGKTLHVAKTYVVEWGNTEAFNWSFDKFYDLLKKLGANTCMGSEDENVYDFEVDQESYETAMANLKQYIEDPDKLSDEVDADDIRKAIADLDKTAQEILDIMQEYYDEAHKADGYLHFSAW